MQGAGLNQHMWGRVMSGAGGGVRSEAGGGAISAGGGGVIETSENMLLSQLFFFLNRSCLYD